MCTGPASGCELGAGAGDLTPVSDKRRQTMNGPQSDNYEVTVTITVGGDDPVDAVRCFLQVCADTSWHPLHAEAVNLESADQLTYAVAYNGRTDTGEVTAISAAAVVLEVPA